MLEERRNEVLRTLVEEYIRSGEPVSSRTIAEVSDLGVSSATIRNDLAALEEDGFVVQPHTSAGRIPTAVAYRYYVDHLRPSKLRTATQTRIAGFFDSVQLELTKLLKATSRLLADVTQLPAVVVAPSLTGERVRDVHLVHLTPDVVLAMVVTENGRVVQERVRIGAPISTDELEDVAEVVSAAAVGAGVGGTVELDQEQRRALEGGPRLSAAEGVLAVIRSAASVDSDVYVGGTQQMAAVWEDLSEVQRVLEVVEREAMILNILARAPGTSVLIGTELPVDVDMAVVSKTYESGTAPGSVGVIGPMRMNYPRVISAVEEVSRELEDRIQS